MKQLEFAKVKGWGGRRRGAGRPNQSGRVNHARRLRITGKTPLHITLRLKPGVVGLRRRKLFLAFNEGLKRAAIFGLRVNHFSLLNNHFHIIAEADDNTSLARGMKSLLGRFGKRIRAETSGVGSVFNGRFHLHVIKSPREMRNALRYVLLNAAHHARGRLADLDPYSSAQYFFGWKYLVGRDERLLFDQLQDVRPDGRFTIGISPPSSWLGLKGWRLARAT